ncbi:MAG: Endonuclease 4 [Chlamydiae bacterium]|nr:Endonuclease 4 [Chlamydiota bacterium]
MDNIKADQLLVGAHTSGAGGLHNALIEGKSIGATTVQIFTANQRQWKSKALSGEAIALFEETLEETGLQAIMSHGSYLVNLGSPKPEVLQKSRDVFREEYQRCVQLGITFLNFHPGAALDGSREECMDRIVESMLMLEESIDEDTPRLLLETTAGQGTVIGSRFEELAYILDRVKKELPVGVCLDTCHSFAAGYDIRTPAGWKKTLDQFDKIIGLDMLCAFHVNDSVKGLDSRRDRHAPLGEGEIGLDAFRFLMSYPPTRPIPKYLETPGGPPLWDKEIWMLREFARKKYNA